MNEWERLRRKAAYMKECYPVGSRVKLVFMDDAQAPPVGTLGTVSCVDAIGTIHVRWDTGSTLGVTAVDKCVRI